MKFNIGDIFHYTGDKDYVIGYLYKIVDKNYFIRWFPCMEIQFYTFESLYANLDYISISSFKWIHYPVKKI